MFEISLEVLIFVLALVGLSIYSAKSSAERSRERERTAERNTIASVNRGYDAGMRLAINHVRLIQYHLETDTDPMNPANDRNKQPNDHA